ncbi:MAG: hypothetical protein RMI89_00240 [Gloeomargarita sp. SKYBB_i_bin120]|nr:hypothetical protein [Gloeomargarita sp. SKYG98]MCS7291390.1 hypothetical protein [Gloeomargarita sp. SKYB120]MDW8176950.1 hypothetical protein [Gloeomargarita sp. SKYBB_i_bin120]
MAKDGAYELVYLAEMQRLPELLKRRHLQLQQLLQALDAGLLTRPEKNAQA